MTKNILKFLNVFSISMLLISSMLALFNIGPSTQPMFMYITSSNTMNMLSIFLIGFTLIISAYLIFTILSKKLKNPFVLGLILPLMLLPMEILLGGNILYMTSLVIVMTISLFNLSLNKKRA